MRLSLFIARRYLFARKKQNAINIISAISVAGVTVGTAALIVVLSVFNGMDVLLQESTDSFTPDLEIRPAAGKYARVDSALCRTLQGMPEVASFHEVMEEKALARFEDNAVPVVVKGVDGDYGSHAGFEGNLVQGDFRLRDEEGYTAVMGYGVAHRLRVALTTVRPVVLYYPDKAGGMNAASLRTELIYPSALFSAQQELADRYMLTDIGFARRLFKTEGQISKIEVRLTDPARLAEAKARLAECAGEEFRVEDKYEINRTFYAMMRSEKLAVFLILLFILLIASFNIIGSISMLILDKKEDLATYRAMGMTDRRIISVFRTEGMLITLAGVLGGFAIGTALCLLQERYGLITLGEGGFLVDAYPVRMVAGDILAVVCTVFLIGTLASYFPVRYLVRKLLSSHSE